MNGKAINGRNTITYHQLYILLLDIQNWQASSPAFALFNSQKIKRFYEQNNLRIQVLNKKLSELTDKYVKKTGDGKLSVVKVNGRDEYEFETEENKIEYGKAFEEFMSRSLEFHI